MENSGRISVNNIALFVDMENLIRTSLDIGLPIDLEPVIKKLLESGRVSMRRGFGDLDVTCRGDWKTRTQIRRMMHENLLQFEDIPYVTPHKNTADMRLTVEALSTAYTYPDIDTFAIVASDRDYVPLIAKLRELGRRIIGIGCSPDTVNEIYVSSCDQFVYYSSLFTYGPRQSINGNPMPVDNALLDAYLQLLCEAVVSIEQRGGKTVGAQIVPLLRQMRPDFDFSLIGFRGFRELAEEAERRGICKFQPYGGDIAVSLTSAGIQPRESQPSISQITQGDAGALMEMYRNFFVSKMRCDMPPVKLRMTMYCEGNKILDQVQGRSDNGIGLEGLSVEIAHVLASKGSQGTQPAAFKVFYALFRNKIFSYEPSEQAYNPRIKGSIVPQAQWDDMFIDNCLYVMKRERRRWPMDASVLAKLFEVDGRRMSDLVEKIKKEFPD